MDRLIYFMNKLWTFVFEGHPLAFFIFCVILYLNVKWVIQYKKPQISKKNVGVIIVGAFLGFTILALIMIFIIGLLLKDQPF